MAARADFLWIGGGRLLTALLGILAIRAATTFLSPGEYGQLAMLLAVQAFCGLFLINPVGQHINRHTHEWWDDGSLLARMRPYRNYVLLVSLVGAAATGFMLSFPAPLTAALAISAVWLAVNAATWNATLIPMLNMVGFRAWSVALSTLTIAAGLLVSVALMQFFDGAVAWYAGQVAGAALGAIWARRVLQARAARGVSGSLPLVDRGVVLDYCLPLAVATGFMWVLMSGYRFMVGHFWGLDTLGFLAVGLLLAGQIWALVETLVQQFLFPLFYRRITGADEVTRTAAMSDLLNLVGPFYLLLAGAMFVGAPSIVTLLAAERYAGADLFLRFGIGIELCRVLGNLAGQAAQVTRQTRSLWFPYFCGTVVAVSLIGFAGVRQGDILWVGYALFLASLATLTTMGRAMHRQLAFSLEAGRWLRGGGGMLLLAAPGFWLARPAGMPDALLVVLLIGMFTLAALYAMGRNAPALKRFLAVDLRGNKT